MAPSKGKSPTPKRQPGRSPAAGKAQVTSKASRAAAQSAAAKAGSGKGGSRKGSTGQRSGRNSPIPAARAARRGLYTWGSVIAVGLVIAIIVVVATTMAPASSTSYAETPMPAAVVHSATNVSLAAYDKVGISTTGSATLAVPTVLPANTPAIVANGKPLVLYVGAEYCPYCAAERWALVTALSRFGTFSGLGATKSSSTDTAANTNTFDFYHSSYQSRYIEFQPVELSTNTPNPTGSGYTALQKLTPTQKVLVSKYGPSGGSIPFVLVSNKLAIQGASFSPGLLAGLSWSDIAAGLSDPSNPVSQSVLATSNYISAGICAASGAQPAAVCNSPGVQSASKALKIG